MILVIDNYDSFVHNLARYFRRLGYPTEVVRNDAISVEQVGKLELQAMVISPGPCAPRDAGASLQLVRAFSTRWPILGVCLGHQVIVEALGGRIIRGREPVHGRTSDVYHGGRGIFRGLNSPMRACRYHSLVADPQTLPPELTVTARTADGTIMAIQHHSLPIVGVQFHPESILTPQGHLLLRNFMDHAVRSNVNNVAEEAGR